MGTELYHRLKLLYICYYVGLDARKPVLGGGGGGFANNIGTDQPPHLQSLINAFIIYVLESSISKTAKNNIQFFS